MLFLFRAKLSDTIAEMKIQVISDLHQEFGFNEISFEKADVVVFAGDTNIGTRGIDWIRERIKQLPVIYILGNHEYYDGSYPETLNAIIDLANGTNIHVLENKSLELEGVTFHGATLWSDFGLFGNASLATSICQEMMNDYRLIRKGSSYTRLKPIDTYRIHEESIRWLESSLSNSSTEKNVVVTHHAPSIKSVPDSRKEDIVLAAYASNLEQTILKYQPDYWIHGHIHQSSHYRIGKANVICNPHGYMKERSRDFNPELLLEI